MKLKKSHKYEEHTFVEMRCPYCGRWFKRYGGYMEGDIVMCKHCDGEFELGRQK